MVDLLGGEGVVEMNEDSSKQFFLKGLKRVRLDAAVDIVSLVGKGDHRRKKASTLQNPDSTRSHALFRLHIQGPHHTQSLLHFVDLAGSENILTHYLHHPNDFINRKNRITEGKKINASLFYLNLVIKLLSEK